MTDTVVRIRRLLSRDAHLAADPSSLAMDANLYDAGLTSHASVSVMLCIEDEFGVYLPDEMLTRATFETIGSLAAAVETLLSHP